MNVDKLHIPSILREDGFPKTSAAQQWEIKLVFLPFFFFFYSLSNVAQQLSCSWLGVRIILKISCFSLNRGI